MYLEAGFSIFPLRYRHKQPEFSKLPKKQDGKGTWQPFAETAPTEEKIREWFTSPYQNIALVMGEVSGNVIALDFDDHGAYDAWVERYPSIARGTATQITKNGAHVLLRVPPPCPPNWAIKLDGQHVGEIRGHLGYIACWPSIHPSGHQYEWIKTPWDSILTIDSLQDVGIARVVETPKNRATVPQNGKHPLPPRTQNFMINGAVVGRGVNDELFNAAIQHAAAGYSLDETIAALLPVAERFYIGTGPGNTEAQSVNTIKSGHNRGQGMEPLTLRPPQDTDNLGKPGSRRGASMRPKNGDLGQSQPGAAGAVEPKSDLGANGRQPPAGPGDIEEKSSPKSGDAEAGDDPDDDNQRPFYTLRNSSMVYTTFKKNGDGFMPVRQVIPFSGQVTKKTILFEDDGEQQVTFTISGKKDQRPYTVDVEAKDFTDGRTLYRRLINYLPGSPPAMEDHLIKRISPAISSLSPKTIPEIKAIGSTGWTPDGKAYVMPSGEPVGQQSYICKLDKSLSTELGNFRLHQNSDEENKMVIKALFDLKKIYRPSAFYVILAHAFLPPLVRWLGDQARYLLHLHAQTGSLKTELAKLMIALYGPSVKSITYKWSGTPVGAESRANALKDALMLIDDLKPNTIKPDDMPTWVAFIQAYVDAEGRKRGSNSGKAGISLPPRCILISTGEAIPEAGEASFTARMLLVQLDAQPDGWNDDLQAIQEKGYLFSGLMRSYIDWLLKNGNKAMGVMRRYQTNKVEAKQGHLRLANNYAANCTAAEMFTKFCQQTGLMSQLEADAFLAAHQQAIIDVLVATGRKIQEERYSHRFLSAIREAVSTGYACIRDDHLQARRVGWEDKDFVYLLSGSMSIVNQWLATTKTPPINIPLKELKQQLFEDCFTHSTPGRVGRMEFDLQRKDPANDSRQLVIAVHRNKFYDLDGPDDDGPEISNGEKLP